MIVHHTAARRSERNRTVLSRYLAHTNGWNTSQCALVLVPQQPSTVQPLLSLFALRPSANATSAWIWSLLPAYYRGQSTRSFSCAPMLGGKASSLASGRTTSSARSPAAGSPCWRKLSVNGSPLVFFSLLLTATEPLVSIVLDGGRVIAQRAPSHLHDRLASARRTGKRDAPATRLEQLG